MNSRYAKQPALDTEALAVELADVILAGHEDERLRWSADGDRVQVRMAHALPQASKRTTEGRRKRLNESLGLHLGIHGWVRGANGWWAYVPSDIPA